MTDTPNDSNEWDESADGWDGDEATQAYAAAAFASLIALVEPDTLRGMSVLDFGCGTGLLIEHLVENGVARVHGVDTSSAMLAVLDAKIADRGWTNVETSGVSPSDRGSFDLVVCSSVLAFVEDHPATVAALVGLLKPGGRFVQWDWERVEGDQHGLSRTEITDALDDAGLVDIMVDVAFEAEAYGQIMRPLIGAGRRSSNR